MTTSDLYAIIYLSLAILGIYCAAWRFNAWCPEPADIRAWHDAQKALHRANRDVEVRVRLKPFKE